MSIARSFIAAVIDKGSVPDLLAFGSIDHLFKGHEVDLWDFVKTHLKNHHVLPKPETVYAHTDEELPDPKEPASYWHELMVKRHIDIELKIALKEAAANLTADNKNPEQALKIVTDKAMELLSRKFQRAVHDFREAYDLVIPDYVSKYTGDTGFGLMTGWPTLDEM